MNKDKTNQRMERDFEQRENIPYYLKKISKKR